MEEYIIMKNDKLEFSEIVGVISEHVGTVFGAGVFISKKLGRCLRNIITTEQGPSKPHKREPAQARLSQTKKSRSPTVKKKAKEEKPKVIKKTVKAKVIKKTVKAKKSSRSQNRPASKAKTETNDKITAQKPQPSAGQTEMPDT